MRLGNAGLLALVTGLRMWLEGSGALRCSVLRFSPALRWGHGLLVLATAAVAVGLAQAAIDAVDIAICGRRRGYAVARLDGGDRDDRGVVLRVGEGRGMLRLGRRLVLLLLLLLLLLGVRRQEGVGRILVRGLEPRVCGGGMVQVLKSRDASKRRMSAVILSQHRRGRFEEGKKEGSANRRLVRALAVVLVIGLSGRRREGGKLIRCWSWRRIVSVVHFGAGRKSYGHWRFRGISRRKQDDWSRRDGPANSPTPRGGVANCPE